MGQVCAKHNEYYEDRCRWCEEPEMADPGFSINRDSFHFWRGIPSNPNMTVEQVQEALNKAWAQVMRHENERVFGPTEGPNDGHGAFE